MKTSLPPMEPALAVHPQPSNICMHRCMCAKSLQLCPTLCNTMDCTLWGSSVHGIPQARILKWIAMTSSRGSSQPRGWTKISLMSSALAGRFFNTSDTLEALIHFLIFIFNWFIAFYEIYSFLNMLIISQNCDFPKKYLKKKKFITSAMVIKKILI